MAEEPKFSFTLSITGADILLGGLDLMKQRLKNPFGRGVDKIINAEVHGARAEAFETEGRSVGSGRGTWARLNAKYAARKARLRPGRGILEWSGRMRASLTNVRHPQSKMSRPTPFKIRIRNKNPLHPFHELGTDTIPARPTFKATKTFTKKLAKHVLDGITGVKSGKIKPIFGKNFAKDGGFVNGR